MTSLDYIKAIAIILEDYNLKSTFLKITFMDAECDTIITKYFVLIYYDGDWYLSFSLNNASSYDIMFYTHELTKYLQDKIIPYTEHYIDLKTNMLYFGEKAHQINNNKVNERMGIKQCPVCDRLLPKELFVNENGYCEICNKITLANITYH